LKPRLELIGAETASEPERAAAHKRLELWLARAVAHELRALVALETAWREGRLPRDARGLAFRLIENAGALDRRGEDLSHVSAEGSEALRRHGVRLGAHTVFMPALIRPRPAQMLAILWHAAHHAHTHAVFIARPGALSVRLDHARTWGECAAAGYRACGRVAVRFDLVERLAEAIAADPPAPDAALARLIGRPVRELPGVLSALGYQRAPPAENGAPSRWRLAEPRRKRAPAHAPSNAFSALANLLPASPHPPQRRRRGPA
jgi:ATP-dependent RNA helicase SUPV3L1/SUV3